MLALLVGFDQLRDFGVCSHGLNQDDVTLIQEHAIGTGAPRRRELLERLGPLLLDEIRELADPDLALMNLASFIAAIGARSSFLELLEQHPATRRVVLSLFASSAYLSTIFMLAPARFFSA